MHSKFRKLEVHMKLHYLFPILALFTVGCSSTMPNKQEIQSVDSEHYFVDSQFDDDMAGGGWVAENKGAHFF